MMLSDRRNHLRLVKTDNMNTAFVGVNLVAFTINCKSRHSAKFI